jgi:hypothetical protein
MIGTLAATRAVVRLSTGNGLLDAPILVAGQGDHHLTIEMALLPHLVLAIPLAIHLKGFRMGGVGIAWVEYLR